MTPDIACIRTNVNARSLNLVNDFLDADNDLEAPQCLRELQGKVKALGGLNAGFISLFILVLGSVLQDSGELQIIKH